MNRRTEKTGRNGSSASKCRLGMFVSIPHPSTVEVAALLGFSFVILDNEQIVTDATTYRSMILAAQKHNIDTLVRLGKGSADRFMAFLGMGAKGILVPGLKTMDEVREAVRMAKYPPDGVRGLGHSPATGFGLTKGWKELIPLLNKDVKVHIIVETKELLDRVEELAKEPGVDAIDIGQLDLSVSLGTPCDFNSDVMRDAFDRIVKAGISAGRPVNCACSSVEDARRFFERGLEGIILDSSFLIGEGVKPYLQLLHGGK